MSGEALSLRDLAALQRDYGPWDALMIGGGAAAQSGIDQVRRAYLLARLGFAGRWQGPEAVDEQAAKLEALEAKRADEARRYQRLRQARPLMTAAGEALPSFIAGRASGLQALQFNMGRGLLEAMMQGDPRAAVTLQEIAGSLRAF